MNISEVLKILLFGLVQGVTEWLPISSTGHMILLDEFIKLNVSAEFMDMFLVLIQLGSIFAVVALFWKRLIPFSFKGGFEVKTDVIGLWIKIVIASVPAAVAGVYFGDVIDEMFLNAHTVIITLILYGVLFIIVEMINKTKKPKVTSENDIPYSTAFFIGIFQMLAVIPGTSRSGATILGGIVLGLSRTAAAGFSFFLAIPAMFGASAIKLIKFGFDFTPGELSFLILGMAAAFAVSLVVIRFLMDFVKNRPFTVFGYYRICLGIVIYILLR